MEWLQNIALTQERTEDALTAIAEEIHNRYVERENADAMRRAAVMYAVAQQKPEDGALVCSLLDWEKISFGEEGISGLEEQLSAIRQEKPFLFRRAEMAGHTPAATGAGEPQPAVSREAFAKMGYRERAELYATQPELYRLLAEQ